MDDGEVPAAADGGAAVDRVDGADGVDAVAGDLDGADADRLGADAVRRLIVDEHRVGGGDAEVGQRGHVDLRRRLGRADLARQHHRVDQRYDPEVLKQPAGGVAAVAD